MRGRAPAVLFLLAALLLTGCGGGADEETKSANAAATAEQATPGRDQGESEADGEEGEQASPQSPAEPNPPIAQRRTPGSKAIAPDVPVSEGGDNSVQAFGLEGEEEQAEQALDSFDHYMQARIAGDWQGACAAASAQFRSQLEMLVERAKVTEKGAHKPKGCAETLELLFTKAPQQALEEAAQVKQVLSFRVRESGYAYLIYENAKGKAMFIAMANDHGAWRVNVPEPASFPETEGHGGAQ